ncbi:unnamed protein product [Coffea canephora]|uniref:NB-ARC domain-containing protein n=2 Tax=Coffea TaxID=13442 RepID=A0A068TXD4_COFCA|nr:putative late blight resistance protein homolog R1A-10 [Coffea arabica]CDP00589.1 unnamed protein product [Coffea canephora]
MEQAIQVSVGFALQNLLQLIDENRRLISDNYEKITDLQADVRLLKAFMAEYTAKYRNSKPLTELADEIRSRVFEVEDLMETYIAEEILYQSKNFFKKAVRAREHLSNLRILGETVQKLSAKVKKTNEDNKEIGLHLVALEELSRESSRHSSMSEENQTGGNQEPDRIIGFEDAADNVLELLGGKKLVQGKSEGEEQSNSDAEQHSESKELEMASIHGMLGLGKTTLARKVLNDLRIEYHFFTRIFVTVSNEYNKKEVLLSILSAFIKNIREQNKTEEELVGMVRHELKYKYLIVMDDVWQNDVWEDIKTFLPDNGKGSRVLVTTRIESVANYVATKTKPYKLRLMFAEEAEELLRIKVFDENTCPEELESIEKKILAKCDRLPLAIVVTAGILRNHPKDLTWWEDVLNGVAELVDNNHQKRIDELIRRSYDNLPDILKSCFLYLGVFPEDLEIPVSKLLQLWIAEGFIPQSERASMEKIAELCLRELVGRNLVMVRRRTLSGRIKTCIIHDTLRDFCKKMARAENLFQQVHTDTNPSSGRRLTCINSHFEAYVRKEQPAEKVRSFLSFGEETTLKKELCSNICKHFKLLRVLDILSVKLPGRFPAQLPNLVLLKFIAICCELQILPRKMSSLVNLQTLIVYTTHPTLSIEADIWGMTKLRHLRTNTSTLLPECSRQCSSSENLQTLSTVAPECLTNDVLERTKKLKKLGIRGNLGTLVKANGESRLFDMLCELVSLENLKLRNDEVTSKLLALPPVHKFPARLTRLSLQDTSLDWQIHMPILGKLRFLEVLKLKDNAFMGEDWQTEGGGFRCLKVLFIGSTNLKSWDAKATNFPQLRCLVLKQCKKLVRIPSDFVYMKHLEMIDLEYAKDSVVSSARRIVQQQLMEIIARPYDKKTTPIKLTVYPPE